MKVEETTKKRWTLSPLFSFLFFFFLYISGHSLFSSNWQLPHPFSCFCLLQMVSPFFIFIGCFYKAKRLSAWVAKHGWQHAWLRAVKTTGVNVRDLAGACVHTRGSRELMHRDMKGQLELSQHWQKEHGLAARYGSRWAGEKEKKKRKWAIALGFGLGYCLGPWFEPTNRGEKWAKLG